jgi:hypothetical protein
MKSKVVPPEPPLGCTLLVQYSALLCSGGFEAPWKGYRRGIEAPSIPLPLKVLLLVLPSCWGGRVCKNNGRFSPEALTHSSERAEGYPRGIEAPSKGHKPRQERDKHSKAKWGR